MPLSFLRTLLDADPSLPWPDYVSGCEDDLGDQPVGPAPWMEELLEDPVVRSVVEAAEGLVPAA